MDEGTQGVSVADPSMMVRCKGPPTQLPLNPSSSQTHVSAKWSFKVLPNSSNVSLPLRGAMQTSGTEVLGTHRGTETLLPGLGRVEGS
jgi:hypothetical protein